MTIYVFIVKKIYDKICIQLIYHESDNLNWVRTKGKTKSSMGETQKSNEEV